MVVNGRANEAFLLCRELRQSLVDMEAFLGILKTSSALPDGPLDLNFRVAFPTAATTSAPTEDRDSLSPSTSHTSAGPDSEHSTLESELPGTSGKRGLTVEIDDVCFGYTKTRQVQSLRCASYMHWRHT